ncbi:beta galactosidase jelly roll domain-containing protein [Roseivirga pacifica]|uniref:beta galactosidase jelly roll domain-containing protein n=1 Tax=Roseivirga pacifica TaxID=1267423 RepID=UPI002094933F|nr:beta galactosidase jelly roll domain-containing protein [Roseivirga pacifica]MCO6358103.1 glycoside hydrolase [Roseivirga pacifica]MCO6366541.1 glycoside hydrolase [Roseivirga pacifica]MCO6371026.1 glycoside hydrolase [Roseivirga pacifica]MCO6373834.1 glycoside hydrolase [Roseivirga pacifica]MCO6380815.1 glycoside hydrolase [Roseivirga pacifica]
MKNRIAILFICMLATAIQAQAQDFDRLFNLRGYWKFSIGDRSEWASTNYDDSEWEEIYVPRRWEREGFHGYDGYAWYRTTFKGSQLEKGKVHYLSLGYIDDVDEVFINGTKIGFSGGFPPDYYTAWNAKRLYRIPNELLDYEGENLIAVRIFDQGGEGGIYSGDVGIHVIDEELKDVIMLEGMWKIRTRDREEYAKSDYDDADWEYIMVPSNWKSIGINDLRDFAWYRKTFEVPRGNKLTEMSIIGGYIDDFDEIYINGIKVGETNDGRDLGWSKSYSRLRIYEIPAGVLKEGKNTIAVRVEDLGANGGIYEGPVVIVPDNKVTRFTRGGYFWR